MGLIWSAGFEVNNTLPPPRGGRPLLIISIFRPETDAGGSSLFNNGSHDCTITSTEGSMELLVTPVNVKLNGDFENDDNKMMGSK